MTEMNLPFKVGHTIELRSFDEGYRGAWFRCKITSKFKKMGSLFYKVEYPDYPDDELDETEVYETSEVDNQKYLMIRPTYPQRYKDNEVPKDGLAEALVVCDRWKVGDLVDWYKDSCYWSGTILEVRKNNLAKVELLPKPYGEGGTYDCLSEDLRPSLEWSLEHGWTVPYSKDGKNRQCAKLVKLFMEGEETREEQVSIEETREEQVNDDEQEQRGDGDLRLNIMESDSIEAAVMDLEEVVVRIEWLQDMLAQDSSDSSKTSTWKYEDYCPSSSSRM